MVARQVLLDGVGRVISENTKGTVEIAKTVASLQMVNNRLPVDLLLALYALKRRHVRVFLNVAGVVRDVEEF
jgi:hypothetical protein